MGDNIEGVGLMIKCMEMESLYGPKGKFIKELIKEI
jgi:hypothetical protein